MELNIVDFKIFKVKLKNFQKINKKIDQVFNKQNVLNI